MHFGLHQEVLFPNVDVMPSSRCAVLSAIDSSSAEAVAQAPSPVQTMADGASAPLMEYTTPAGLADLSAIAFGGGGSLMAKAGLSIPVELKR